MLLRKLLVFSRISLLCCYLSSMWVPADATVWNSTTVVGYGFADIVLLHVHFCPFSNIILLCLFYLVKTIHYSGEIWYSLSFWLILLSCRAGLSLCCFGCCRSVSAKIPDSSWKTVLRTSWIFCLMPTSICVSYWANMRRARGWSSSVRMTTLKSTSTAWWRNPNEPSDCSKRGRRGCMRSSHRTGNTTSLGPSPFLPLFFLVSFRHILDILIFDRGIYCGSNISNRVWPRFFLFCWWEHFCSVFFNGQQWPKHPAAVGVQPCVVV